MSVTNNTPIVTYVADGLKTSFALTFEVEGKDNIKVSANNLLVSKNDYNYSSTNNSINFYQPVVSGTEIKLERNTDLERSEDYTAFGNSFRPETLNYDFDRIWRALQEKGVQNSEALASLINTLQTLSERDRTILDAVQDQALADIKQDTGVADLILAEAEARKKSDEAYNLLAALEAGQTLPELKSYVDNILGIQNPNLLTGITSRLIVDHETGETQKEINDVVRAHVQEQESLNVISTQNINDLLLKTHAFVTPEMFGAVANKWEVDNTQALNAAFATGKDVYSSSDKVYTCNGNVKTKGQKCIGGWKIRSSKPVVGMSNWTNTCSTYSSPCDFTYLQGIYFAYAYDLAELLAVRELGYNTILHYGGMHISGYDNDGTVQDLLNNAKTAGVQVLLGTQNSLNGMSLESFVNAHKNHTSLLGFLIADEPRHNNISVAQQKTKIDTMKALTNKPLACSDFTYDAFTEVLAIGYDYIFGDVYNNANETQEQTLYKMRAWLGLTAKRHPNAKVLPAVMGFKYTNGASLEDIMATSKIFAKACGGNFACFAWDGLGESVISNSIRDTVAFQDLSKTICSYKTGVYKIPECYAWGGVTELLSQVNYGLQDVLKTQVRVDPYSTGFYEGVNSYPAQMNGATVDGERTSVAITVGQAISGIWFKNTYGAFISNIKMKRKNHFTVQSGMLAKGDADVILTVRGSSVGGYGLGSVLATLPKDGSVATVVFDNIGINDSFCIKYDCSVDPQFYRTYVRGVYVTSDW